MNTKQGRHCHVLKHVGLPTAGLALYPYHTQLHFRDTWDFVCGSYATI